MTAPRHLSPEPPATVRARIHRRITAANTPTRPKLWAVGGLAACLTVAAVAGIGNGLGDDWTPTVAAATPTADRSEPVARGGPIGGIFPTDIAETVARIDAETTPGPTPSAPAGASRTPPPAQGAQNASRRASSGSTAATVTPATSTPVDRTTTPTATPTQDGEFGDGCEQPGTPQQCDPDTTPDCAEPGDPERCEPEPTTTPPATCTPVLPPPLEVPCQQEETEVTEPTATTEPTPTEGP
jgi:hypothetical protein